jgi:UDPglucose 6-dehydrogenase
MQIAVVGTGYVGLVVGACLAETGNDVVCCDIDENKIERLRRAEIPIYEPGLEPLVERNLKEGRLSFTTDVAAAVRDGDVIFIAVGTPPGEDGSADLQHVLAVAETIGRNMPADGDEKIVITKSTVPVGTADRVRAAIAARTSHPFAVVSNPEFLKEGDAVNDFMKPDRVIIGTDDARAAETLRHLYAPFVRTNDRVQVMDARSAELTKYAANALLATRISFMNELANLAERVGADIEKVRKGIGSDPRIGPKFLFPGAGFGGSCFPKDLRALIRTAEEAEQPLEIVQAVDRVNHRQKGVLAAKIERHFGGPEALAGRRVAVWGLAFKPQTDDVREAPALALIDRLLDLGCSVCAHDPVAIENVRARYGEKIDLCHRMYDALEGSEALALVTEWHDFRRPDFERIRDLMRAPVVFDGRNIWDPAELRGLGFTYYGIGRP